MRRRLDLAATLCRARGAVPRRADHRARPPGPQRALGRARARSCGGATILLTTQYLEEADRLADDIVVIDHGRVIARGDARSLKREVGGDQLYVVCAPAEDIAGVAELLEGSPAPPTVDLPSGR